jgi:hypothetical protein
MTKINRRSVLGVGLVIGALGLQTQRNAAQAVPDDPAKMEQWLEFARDAKSIDSPLLMGRFLEPMYYLLEPISWTPAFVQASKLSKTIVPKGFVTDLASIPPILYSYLRPDGPYAYAAIIHDYLYWEQKGSIGEANDILKAAMEDLKVDWAKIQAIYAAVSLKGQKYWDINKTLKEQGEKRCLQEFPANAGISWEDFKKRKEVFCP